MAAPWLFSELECLSPRGRLEAYVMALETRSTLSIQKAKDTCILKAQYQLHSEIKAFGFASLMCDGLNAILDYGVVRERLSGAFTADLS